MLTVEVPVTPLTLTPVPLITLAPLPPTKARLPALPALPAPSAVLLPEVNSNQSVCASVALVVKVIVLPLALRVVTTSVPAPLTSIVAAVPVPVALTSSDWVWVRTELAPVAKLLTTEVAAVVSAICTTF